MEVVREGGGSPVLPKTSKKEDKVKFPVKATLSIDEYRWEQRPCRNCEDE
jgi:hypothetical protein